ncbi:MAG: hypothetical protein ABWZ77_04375 [Naasia sp.]
MDATWAEARDQLRDVPMSDLRLMLEDNAREHRLLREQGLGPGEQAFDDNSLLYLVILAAFEERGMDPWT